MSGWNCRITFYVAFCVFTVSCDGSEIFSSNCRARIGNCYQSQKDLGLSQLIQTDEFPDDNCVAFLREGWTYSYLSLSVG